MGRPSKDQYFIEMAQLVAKRSTCLRRSVGCVLVDGKGHVLATGYNGVAAGLPHCNEPGTLRHVDMSPEAVYPYACDGAHAKSGENLNGCEAIHAEQNALLQCRNIDEIETVYVTTAPCVTCVKLFMNTSAMRIVFLDDYPHSDQSSRLWHRAGRIWEKKG